MANQPSANKRHISMRVNVEVCRAIEKRFGRDDDNNSTIAFIRALEDAARDVELTAEDLELIAEEIRANQTRNKGA